MEREHRLVGLDEGLKKRRAKWSHVGHEVLSQELRSQRHGEENGRDVPRTQEGTEFFLFPFD